MSREWPSALDASIAAGEAEPISEAEKTAARRFKIAYEAKFNAPDATKAAAGKPVPTTIYGKFMQALGLANQ